ncbi:hypothetical protein QCA50_019412 [Cerrena zonata]|uniref:Uncharacterized protein n=1 Tax=Cerrena zonata TaxID=2478898 RepID=A0AAW0FB93_9APHY
MQKFQYQKELASSAGMVNEDQERRRLKQMRELRKEGSRNKWDAVVPVQTSSDPIETGPGGGRRVERRTLKVRQSFASHFGELQSEIEEGCSSFRSARQ